uniref:Cilia- and flagella-associated protein 53 n=1 Tax=Lotharella globosa TaxID=91324 RepID=A0A7S3ZG13_9EUKA
MIPLCKYRLAQMLKQDDIQFQREIDASVETIEKRMQRMANRAYELREKRESARKKKADELYYQRFRRGCDELRGLDAEKHKKLMYQERAKQLEINAEKRKKEVEAEKMYTKMWLAEAQKKEERHKRDIARIERLNNEQATALRHQMRIKDDQREAERQRILQEKREIKDQAEADRQLAAKRKDEKDAERKRIQEQVHRYNQLRLMQKNMMRQQELNDGEELNRINKEAMDREQQEFFNKKMNLKRDNEEYLNHIRAMKAEEQRYQKELDKCVQDEVDRANRKQEAEMQRRAMQRQHLMDQVHAERQATLRMKENRQIAAMREKERDRQDMLRAEREYKEHLKTEGRDAYLRRKQVEADQLRLIAQKQQKAELEKAQAIHERVYIEHATKKLDEWLEKEKADPKLEKPWHGLTKSNWYS